MTNQNDSHNFWSGFALGVIGGGFLMYGIATKRGRKTLENILNNAESIEENIEGILETLQNRHLSEKKDDETKE